MVGTGRRWTHALLAVALSLGALQGVATTPAGAVKDGQTPGSPSVVRILVDPPKAGGVFAGWVDEIGEFLLGGKKDAEVCTGTVVSRTWILTAAHCVIEKDKKGVAHKVHASKVHVQAGGGPVNGDPKTFISVSRVEVYGPALQQPEALPSDVALIQVKTDLALGGTVPMALVPPTLPNQTRSIASPDFGFYGYGLTDGIWNPVTQEFDNKVYATVQHAIAPGDYAKRYCGDFITTLWNPTDICFQRLGTSAVMPGDSGGPWVAKEGALTLDGTSRTTSPLIYATESKGQNCGVGGSTLCADQSAADIGDSTVNEWIAATATTVMSPAGQCIENSLVQCVISNTTTSELFLVEPDGFARLLEPIAAECYDKIGFRHIRIDSFDMAQVPQSDGAATIAAGCGAVSITPTSLQAVQACVPFSFTLHASGLYVSDFPLWYWNVLPPINEISLLGISNTTDATLSGRVVPGLYSSGTLPVSVGVHGQFGGTATGTRDYSIQVLPRDPTLDANCAPLPPQ